MGWTLSPRWSRRRYGDRDGTRSLLTYVMAARDSRVQSRTMFRALPPVIRGVIAATLLGLNTLLWCGTLFAVALLKLVLPTRGFRTAFDRALNGIATWWISGNSAWMRATQRTEWDVAGFDNLDYGGWYLVNCNHQSWVDILVLQHLLNRRIPMLKFFLKRQLMYVPVMGLAWWALDFPVHAPPFRGGTARTSRAAPR